MSAGTGIEWTRGDDGSRGATWNFASGCTRQSEACEHCYIERTPPFRMAHRRFDGDGVGSTTGVLLHPNRMSFPLRLRKPTRIFVCSLTDLFHRDIPDEYIAQAWAVMALAPRHTFMVLTKRHGRMRSLIGSARFAGLVYRAINELLAQGNPHRIPDTTIMTALDGFARGQFTVLPNVWGGVTAENAKWLRIRGGALRTTPFAIRFLSIEPLLAPIDDADLTRINWIIVGGESGPQARPMHPDWARSLRDQAQAANVAFLFKQWGEHVTVDQMPPDTFMSWDIKHGNDFYSPDVQWRVGKKRAGRLLDGRTWDEFPQVAAHV